RQPAFEVQPPKRRKMKRRLFDKYSSIIRLRPTHPKHAWSRDFRSRQTQQWRVYKMLTVRDDYTRQALVVEVWAWIGSENLLEAMYGLFLRHDKPEFTHKDHGPNSHQKSRSGGLRR
ncbi:hypothetical protein R3X27_24435, partial [Tropicimonas sp. TH_r6]|nr:hypothetical protein [Tropicimonas sp. TH_r6]